MKNSALLSWIPFLLVSGVLQANELYPSPIQFREVDGTIIRTTQMTLNGAAYSGRMMPDIDGDGRAEWYFRTADPIDPECGALTIAMSTQVPGSDFVTGDLSNMMRVRRSRDLDENGIPTGSCTFISANAVIDDLNGDGIGEIRVSVDTVVLGNTAQGTIIDANNLNGQDGFVVEAGRRPYSVGDINGDGFNDFSAPMHLFGGRIYSGQGQFPAFYGRDVNDEDQLLIDIDTASSFIPLGDINGDGYDDVGVRPAQVIYGAADINLSIAELEELGAPILTDCLTRICTMGPAGDFDNDGFDDMVVSTREVFEAMAEAAIVYGGPDGFPVADSINDLDPSRTTQFYSQSGSNIYNRISESRTMRDFNNDGVDELFVEAFPGEAVIFATPGRRLKSIAYDSLDGSDGVYVSPNPLLC